MKKISNMFLGNGLLTLAVVSGIFITGCNDSAYNKEGETATAAGKDSMVAINDNNVNGGGVEIAKDTTATVDANGTKVPLANPSGAKTAKKGKVSIVPAETPADKNTAIEMDKEGYYKNTEILPAYPGGQKALERFFEDNIKYPDAATENEAQGTVHLNFSVDENGKIYQPVAVGDKLGFGIEEEAIRVFNKMPKWNPGKIKGKNVKTRYTLPIKFQLY